MNVLNVITRAGGRVWLKARGHAPAILFIAGTAFLGLTVASAIKDTMTAEPILDKHEDQLAQIEFDKNQGKIDEDAAKKAARNAHISMAIDFAKHYGRTAVLVGLTLASYGGSYSILHRRYTGAMLAAAAVTESYEKYRKRVREDQGAEKDMEYYTGHKLVEEAEIVKTPNDDGVEEETVVHDLKRYCDMAELESTLGYSVVLSAADGSWIFDENDLAGSERLVRTQVNYGNNVLNTRGWFGFDEMLKSLHKQVTITSKALAWRRENGPITCDIQRIWYNDKPDGTGTSHPAFILNFNIDPEKMAIEDLPIPKI